MADQAAPALSLLAVSMGVTVFQQMSPPLSEIRKRTPRDDPSFAADVRVGECAATAITVGVGIIASGLAGSSIPLWIAILVSGMMVAVYEVTLNRYRPLEAKA